METPSPSGNWSVLVLCTGFGNEGLRSFVETTVKGLGFDVHVYDAAGYPVDPTIHSHAACINAIPSHDIILAFADETEGGEFQIAEAPAAMVADLRTREIIPQAGTADSVPTIFQVEVMTARSLGKPTIVFIDRDVQIRVDQTLKMLRANELNVTPKTGTSSDLEVLIKASKWSEIQRDFEVPTGRIESFRQVAFLERVRKERPNFISYYDSRSEPTLGEEIESRLASVVEVFIKEHVALVTDKIERKRDPLRTESLQDLINLRLIISSPFKSLSGDATSPLFSDSTNKGGIATLLTIHKDVLLLGRPGLGKTTASLLTFRDLANQAGSQVEGLAPLYASWRTLLELEPKDKGRALAENFIRLLIGLPRARLPWPSRLRLPNKDWILVLDGLDESPSDRDVLIGLIKELTVNATLLVSCREYDYERHLQAVRHDFNVVIKLLPWESQHIRDYLEALKLTGKYKAVEFINSYLEQNQLPDFISLPLWLSVLTYLAERSPVEGLDLRDQNDYELLRLCVDAVADDELERHNATANKSDLQHLWEVSAWELNKARRNGRTLRIPELETLINTSEEAPLGRAVFALLDIFGEKALGFFHEVFQEYWLAEFLVDKLADGRLDPIDLAGYFSYQRSVITNRFIRRRIRSRENIPAISLQLQQAVRSANKVPQRALFSKNQLVYLLGRIGGAENLNFLSTIWNSKDEPQFVKHSAAFGAIILGDEKIEKEYYELLNAAAEDDEMNRGYHLYYYGGIDATESEMPIMDTGQGDADGTLRRLFERLSKTDQRYLNLRRIEMFTLRRFLEMGRILPDDIEDPKDIIAKAASDVQSHGLTDDFINGVRIEADKLIALLP